MLQIINNLNKSWNYILTGLRKGLLGGFFYIYIVTERIVNNYYQVVQCYNRGWDGLDVNWECKTDLDMDYRLGEW